MPSTSQRKRSCLQRTCGAPQNDRERFAAMTWRSCFLFTAVAVAIILTVLFARPNRAFKATPSSATSPVHPGNISPVTPWGGPTAATFAPPSRVPSAPTAHPRPPARTPHHAPPSHAHGPTAVNESAATVSSWIEKLSPCTATNEKECESDLEECAWCDGRCINTATYCPSSSGGECTNFVQNEVQQHRPCFASGTGYYALIVSWIAVCLISLLLILLLCANIGTPTPIADPEPQEVNFSDIEHGRDLVPMRHNTSSSTIEQSADPARTATLSSICTTPWMDRAVVISHAIEAKLVALFAYAIVGLLSLDLDGFLTFILAFYKVSRMTDDPAVLQRRGRTISFQLLRFIAGCLGVMATSPYLNGTIFLAAATFVAMFATIVWLWTTTRNEYEAWGRATAVAIGLFCCVLSMMCGFGAIQRHFSGEGSLTLWSKTFLAGQEFSAVIAAILAFPHQHLVLESH